MPSAIGFPSPNRPLTAVRREPLISPLRWIATGGELLLMVWSIPAVILLFGLPFVLVLRGIVEIGERLFGR
jgi:hypothetical protein